MCPTLCLAPAGCLQENFEAGLTSDCMALVSIFFWLLYGIYILSVVCALLFFLHIAYSIQLNAVAFILQ